MADCLVICTFGDNGLFWSVTPVPSPEVGAAIYRGLQTKERRLTCECIPNHEDAVCRWIERDLHHRLPVWKVYRQHRQRDILPQEVMQ